MTSLHSFGVLDVLSEYASSPSLRAPCPRAPCARSLRDPLKIPGLALLDRGI